MILRKRSRLFYTYFTIFTVVFLLLFSLLAILLHEHVINSFFEIYEKDYTALLENQANAMEHTIRALIDTAYQIERMSNMRFYALDDHPVNKTGAIRNLNAIKATNPIISSIGFYYEQRQNYFITTAGTMNAEIFAKNYMNNSWDAERFLREVTRKGAPRLVLTGSAGNDSKNQESFMLFVPFPQDSLSNQGTIFFVLNAEMMTDVIPSIKQIQDYFIKITDLQEGYEYSVNPKNSPNGDKALNEDYLIVESDISFGYRYLVGIGKQQLLERISPIWYSCIFLLSALFILGGFISFIMADRIYKPILGLSKMIGITRNHGNELKLIFDGVADMVKVKHQLQENISRIRIQLFETLLLKKHNDLDDIKELQSFAGLELDYPYLCVFCISSKTFNEEKMHRILHYMEQRNGIIYSGRYQRFIIIISNLGENTAETAQEYGKQLMEDIRNHCGLPVRVCVGTVVDNLLGLHQSFLDAKYVHDCNIFEEESGVMTLSEVMEILNNDYIYPRAVEAELFKALSSSDESAAMECTAMMSEFLQREKISPELVRGIYIDILRRAGSHMESEGFILPEWRRYINSFIQQTYDDYSDIGQKFAETIKALIRNTQKTEKIVNNELVNKIYKYIDDNYQTYEISLNSVSEAISLSPSYATKIFKEATGYSIKEYIDYRKIQEAKHLLSETDMNLSKIAAMTGCLDTSSFCRKFKAKEGLTPEQYRRLNRKCLCINGGAELNPVARPL